jgi:hypothetical protein
MKTPKIHFEKIPVEAVRKLVEAIRVPKQEDWRELAQRIQVETDPNKMLEMIQIMMEKFDEEKHRKGPQRRTA